MAAPRTKDWNALENKHRPSGLHVIVSGLVELAPGQRPVLTERTGATPGLELALTAERADEADFKGKVWKAAQFHKEVKQDQYNDVRVFWNGGMVADFPVFDDREHAESMAAQTAAQNKAAGVKQKASTAKKVVKKTVDAVKKVVDKVAKAVTGRKKATKKTKKVAKKAPKAVGGWAKGRTKKAAKKAVKKKAARKTRAKKRR